MDCMKDKPRLNKAGNRRGMSDNSHKNIVKAQESLKGNNHAHKDYSITRIVKDMLDNPVEKRWLDPQDYDKGLTWRQAIARRLLVEALHGNAKVTSELLDRLEGKVTQTIGGEGGGPVILRIVDDD